jgi:hypothetical protein
MGINWMAVVQSPLISNVTILSHHFNDSVHPQMVGVGKGMASEVE